MAILRVHSCRRVPRSLLIATIFVFVGFTECLKFTLEPQSVDVEVRKTLSLTCSAETDNEPIEYTWRRNGRTFRTSSRKTVQKDGSRSVLSIDPVQKNDAGSYTCVAVDSASEKITSQAAQVVVYSICSAPEVVKVSDSAVVQGMEVILKCKCSHLPSDSTSVAWTKDGVVLQEKGNVVMEDNKLMISDVSRNNEGKYGCVVTNKLTSVKTSDQEMFNLELEAGSPAQILTKPEDVVVLRKKSARLDCKYVGDPIPQMKWYYEGEEISDDNGISILRNGSLYITQVYSRHEGTYTCSVTNKFNSVAASADIEIAYIAKIDPIPDSLVPRGSPARLQCNRPDGAPRPDLKWTKPNGAPLPNDPRYTTECGSDSPVCTLNIDNAKVQDSGEFVCVASNSMAKTRTRIGRLSVQVPPKIIKPPQDKKIIEGEFLELVCEASGTPKPNIMWQKEGKKNNSREAVKTPAQVHSNGSLTISKSQLTDSGRYFCGASTPAGWYDEKEATVKVLERVKINSRHRLEVVLNAKKDAKLRCIFDGEPPITIKWSRKGKKDLPKRATPQNSTLLLRRASPQDNGVYKCKASNGFSQAEAFVNVTVVRFPKFVVVPSNKTAKESSSVWFHCNASGDPKPVISWSRQQKNGDKLDPERFIQHKNGSMEIKNVQVEDEGSYYCIAGNRGQMTQVTVRLDVFANPKASGRTAPSMVRTIGIAVGCAAAYIILVVGLMIYCKGRRTQYARKKSVINGTLTQGENKGDEEVALNHLNSLYKRRGSYNKWQFPRHDLEALSTLGNGVYGRCFLAKAGGIKDGEKETTVIVKALMSKDEIIKDEFMQEMDMMCRIQNENVVQLLGLCKEEEPLYIIAETLDKGDLKAFLQATSSNGRSTILNSTQKIDLCAQIAAGMNYLSAHEYLHKDLAARNILISKDLQIKIGFMALSQDTNRSDYYFFDNSFIPLRWMPSEAILEKEFSDKSDVWSFGVVMWEIFTNGKRPYEERSDEEVLKCQRNNDLKLTKPDHCTPEIFEVMNKCWDMDPAERPTFGELANDFSDMDGDSNV